MAEYAAFFRFHYWRAGLIGPLLRFRLRHPTGPAYAAWTPRGWEITGHP